MQRKNKRRNNNRKKFDSLDNDFMFGGNGMSDANVYRDFYGGRTRFKGCQKRVLRVSFRDLNWQVRSRDIGLGSLPKIYQEPKFYD